jgi:uncharacterized membrane protein
MKIADVVEWIIVMSVILCLHHFNWIDLMVVYTGFLIAILMRSDAIHERVCALEEISERTRKPIKETFDKIEGEKE